MAFSELYCDSTTGSNLNAGFPIGGIYPITSIGGAYLRGGGAGGTDRFTAGSGTPFSNISNDDAVSIYLDAASAPTTFIGRITAHTNTTLDISLTAIAGTRFATTGSGVTAKVGGAWLGPTGTSGFPFNFVTNTLTNINGDIPRINLKGTSNVTSAITHSLTGPIVFQGMTTNPDDGGRWILDGGISGVSYTVLTISGTNVELRDTIIRNNGATGQAGIFVSSGTSCLLERIITNSCRGGGITATGNYGQLVECEAYACNQANASGGSGIRIANSSTCLRCISHDNVGSNSIGFILSNASTAIACIADTNGLDGFNCNTAGFTVVVKNCDCYNNGGAGVKLINNVNNLLIVENCNLIKNGTYGVINSGSSSLVRLSNCGFGAGSQANLSGPTSGVMDVSNSITYADDITPWIDPVNGDFRLNLATAKGTGRGTFTQTASGYAGTVAYPDVGAVQSNSLNTDTNPGISNVRSGTVYSYLGTSLTGTLIIPSISNIRLGTVVDNTTGTLVVPSAANVRLGTSVDNTTGTLAVPSASQVLAGIAIDNTIGTLGLGALTSISGPVSQTGIVNLIRGDDYFTADERQLIWTDVENSWPDLVGATVTVFLYSHPSGLNISFLTTINTPSGSGKSISLQLTSAQTNNMTAYNYDYHIIATLSNGHEVTLVKGIWIVDLV